MTHKKFLQLDIRDEGIITWGGLHGLLSLALVMSLPDNETINVLLITTYFCVLFSIIIQGLTIEKIVKTNDNKTVANTTDHIIY